MIDDKFIIKGRILSILGDNIDTDIIYPGKYLNVTDKEKTPEHLFELVYPEIIKEVQKGDILLAGKNFGCGSSREQAATALKYAGFSAIIAGSFSRIFFRNAINQGLPLITCSNITDISNKNDELELRLLEGKIINHTNKQDAECSALDEKALGLLQEGGLIPYLKKKYSEQ